MKILVYGAGVQASYLAHVLIRGGNDVTVLARGKRSEELQKDGIVIRHYLQCKTTVDSVNVISTLEPDDVYDLIFVSMMYSDFPAVLPILAHNQSRHIVLVGNNANAESMQQYLKENSATEKKVIFGFQTNGGRRENGRVINIRFGSGHMDLGTLDGDRSWRPLLERAFVHTSYKLGFAENIDAWLKSHMVLILALHGVMSAYEGNLGKAASDKKRLNQVIAALDEGHRILETLGYPIIPAAQAQLVRRRPLVYLFLKIFTVTPIASIIYKQPTPAQLAEYRALYHDFASLKQKASLATPNWDALTRHIPESEANAAG
ncbi:ketopantoate reductase family protein [Ktedonosporobacter rubrisoli]|uniref:Ketopantoate reductase family protein n=1 Tax=Ktedonosporobacter rubrisoli TaxID=2509675 RepID=A0A4P6JLA9_KTERU|nr:2-dehydropantoate 2-reductase N-terminal domain-containing protein [Ktedonosporobacter rubrisoli]QBD75988.1 ketopantoate reductase family protein [Ktedonosporobacter rubrisoli]